MNKRYQVLSFLLIAIFISGSAFSYLRRHRPDDKTKELEALKIIFPEADNFSEKFPSPPHYKAYKRLPGEGEKEFLGAAFLTTDIAPEIRGYAGPIKMMAGLKSNGRIVGITVISHSETPSYVLGLDEFIQKLSTLDISNSFILGKDVDGISRATITSEAITRAVSKSVKTIGTAVFNLPANTDSQPSKHLDILQIFFPLLIFVVAALSILSNKIYLRWISLSLGLFYLGFFKSTMVSIALFANTGLGKIPAFVDNPLWFMLVVLTILGSFVFGMIYCGNICPFASVQEWLFKIANIVTHKSLTFSEENDKKFKSLRFVVLFSVLTASFLAGNAQPAAIEPFLTFFTQKGSTLAWMLLVFILIVSAFHFRFWCKYLCPVGALNGLFSLHSLFKIKLGHDCTGCEICKDVCPTNAITFQSPLKPVIDYPQCVCCLKCLEECPQNSSLQGKK